MSRNIYAKPLGAGIIGQMSKNRALSRYLAELGRKGGKARTSKMTPAERTKLARKAAEARWVKAKRGA
jgi:hypothetical protein